MRSAILKNGLIVFFVLITFNVFSQNWVWKKGSGLGDQNGTYGAVSVSSYTNNPGSREGAATWTDADGNFWLFAGAGYAETGGVGYLSDLWKYNTSSNEWVWIKGNKSLEDEGVYGTKGTASALNNPGARRYAVTWCDANGNLWLFGGYGYDGISMGYLNDLWKYNISSNEWTWISGDNDTDLTGVYGTIGVSASTNKPGSRSLSTGWIDNNGDLWLFGGYGYSSTAGIQKLNDLWKYNVSSNQWVWMGGNNTSNDPGTYGTIGVANSSNKPGARYASVTWKDSDGNLFLYGGLGISGTLNDLWKYNIANNVWTWIKGSNLFNQTANYGTIGVSSATNNPGSREGAIVWKDWFGNIWMALGRGYASTTTLGYLNDLWKYNIGSNEWTWMKGSQTVDQISNYGTIDVSNTSNSIGARMVASSWIDLQGNIWAFGGYGYGNSSNFRRQNDLWKYENCISSPATPTNTTSGSNLSICSGAVTTISVSSDGPVQWHSTNISVPIIAHGSNYVTPTLALGTYSYFASAAGCTANTSRVEIVVTVDDCNVGINELSKLNSSVFPNPINNHFIYNASTNGVIYLYNNTGVLISKYVVEKGHNKIAMEENSNGLYFLKDEKGSIMKVVKAN